MSRRGQTLQAIGDDGIYYSWYRRPYNRRIPTHRQLQQQSNNTNQEEETTLTMKMLNPKQTNLSELGELILVRNEY